MDKKQTNLKITAVAAIVYGMLVAWFISGFMSGERGHGSYVFFAPLVALYIVGGIGIFFLRHWARKLLMWSLPVSVLLLLLFCVTGAEPKKGFILFIAALFVVCVNPLLIGPPVIFLIYFSRKQVKQIFLKQQQNISSIAPVSPREIVFIVLVIAGTYFFFSSQYYAGIEEDLCRLRASDYRPGDFPDDYKVIDVMNGNTLKLSNGEIVNFIGVKAPTVIARGQYSSSVLIDLAYQSKKFTEGLLRNKKVSIFYEHKKRDASGHLLAKIYITGFSKNEIIKLLGRSAILYECLDDGFDAPGLNRKEKLQRARFRVDLNDTLLYAGYAVVSDEASSEQKSYYEHARENRAGLWAHYNLDRTLYGTP